MGFTESNSAQVPSTGLGAGSQVQVSALSPGFLCLGFLKGLQKPLPCGIIARLEVS